MKSRPILFTAPMVRAILDGRKTQTRQIVKPQTMFDGKDEIVRQFPNQNGCPKGDPLDRLWIQENHRMRTVRLGPDEYEVEVEYAADRATSRVRLTDEEWEKMLARQNEVTDTFGSIIPGRFMYRSLSRITLEITAVRVERLQTITEQDAKAEGCNGDCPVGYIPAHQAGPCAYHYAQLWESINGPGSWDANPRVWVIEFRQLNP